MNVISYQHFLFVKLKLTFKKAVKLVRLKNISIRTFTVITPCCIVTVMGTSSFVSETLINICNNNITGMAIKVCSPLQDLPPCN